MLTKWIYFIIEMLLLKLLSQIPVPSAMHNHLPFSPPVPSSMPWEFPTTPVTTEVSDTVLHVSWESPRPRPQGKETTPTGRPYLVYTLLFWDDNNPRWSRVTSVSSFKTN